MPAIESPPLIDAVAAPISLVIFVGYHMFWIYRRSHHPETSMPALMGAIRKVWLLNIMKSGKHIDAVQTMRNWILAASFLATGALSLLVALPTYCNAVGEFIPKGDLLGWKLLCLMICCLGAFFCFAQSIRYFNHTVIMVNCQMGGDDYWNLLDGIDILRDVDIAASNAGNVLNRGCNFFTLGLRFFYTTFPLLMWLYGPWFLLGTTILLVAVFWHMDGTIGVKKSIVKRRMSVVNSRQDIELANLR